MKKAGLLFMFFFLYIYLGFAQSSVWEINHNGNTLYLGGSIHVLREEDFPLPREFDEAYGKSETIVLETDPQLLNSPEIAAYLMTNMLLPEGKTLGTVLSREAYKKLLKKCKDRGISIDDVKRWKPSIIINVLSVMEAENQ